MAWSWVEFCYMGWTSWSLSNYSPWMGQIFTENTISSNSNVMADRCYWSNIYVSLHCLGFFRSAELEDALEIIYGMFGVFGIELPDAIGSRLTILAPFIQELGITFYLGGGKIFIETWSWIALAALIAFFFPNTQEIMQNFKPALDFQNSKIKSPTRNLLGYLVWQPSRWWSVWIGVITVISLLSLNRPNDFLYFQF